jgi:hypothetical protein
MFSYQVHAAASRVEKAYLSEMANNFNFFSTIKKMAYQEKIS